MDGETPLEAPRVSGFHVTVDWLWESGWIVRVQWKPHGAGGWRSAALERLSVGEAEHALHELVEWVTSPIDGSDGDLAPWWARADGAARLGEPPTCEDDAAE